MLSASAALGRTFSITAAGLDGLSLRQQVRGENLANINTPGYRARTVDFEGTLRSAMSNSASGTGTPFGASPRGADGAMLPAGLADGMTGGTLSGARGAGEIDSSRFSIREAGGDGAVDRVGEASGMAQDLVRFRVLTQQVTNRIQGLRNVISEMGRA